MNQKLPISQRQSVGHLPVFKPSASQLLAKQHEAEIPQAIKASKLMTRGSQHSLAVFMLAVDQKTPLDAACLTRAFEITNLETAWLHGIYGGIEGVLDKAYGRQSFGRETFAGRDDVIAEANIVFLDVHKYLHHHRELVLKELETPWPSVLNKMLHASPVMSYKERHLRATCSKLLLEKYLPKAQVNGI